MCLSWVRCCAVRWVSEQDKISALKEPLFSEESHMNAQKVTGAQKQDASENIFIHTEEASLPGVLGSTCTQWVLMGSPTSPQMPGSFIFSPSQRCRGSLHCCLYPFSCEEQFLSRKIQNPRGNSSCFLLTLLTLFLGPKEEVWPSALYLLILKDDDDEDNAKRSSFHLKNIHSVKVHYIYI